MTTFANIVPTAETDGIAYCTNVPLTPTEADLGDGLLSPRPIPVVAGQSVVALITLTVNGLVTGNSTYVAMQTDMGDNNWVDLATLLWTTNNISAGSLVGTLTGGALRTINAGQVNSRNMGTVPASTTGTNAPVCGRVRFTGQARFTGGSSSAPGVTTQITATILYKILNPR